MADNKSIVGQLEATKQELEQTNRLDTIIKSLPRRSTGGFATAIPTEELGSWRKGPALIGIIMVSVLGIIGTLALAEQSFEFDSRPVNSFQTCKNIGGEVYESNPRQCRSLGGQVYTE